MTQAPVFEVRRLGESDLVFARAMNALYADAFEDPGSYADALPDDDYLLRLLAQPGTIALVAQAEGSVIGALTAYTLPKFEQARSEIYVYDLAVAESCRRRGVAAALIEATIGIARSEGAWAVFVQADYGDDPAVALYTKLGRREEVMHFDLHLGDEGD